MKPNIDNVQTFESGIKETDLNSLLEAFPLSHFAELSQEKFPFYKTTFWYPFDRPPSNIFENIIDDLKAKANPSATVTGVEWWFSVLSINATPQWLLNCHFDRDNIREKEFGKVRHPDRGSVLFLNDVPYGELVVTDQRLTERGIRPKQPKEMRFIQPKRNLYAVFPGHLYHGVIGRMWRPISEPVLRVSMAINYWNEKSDVPYLLDSREWRAAFKFDDTRAEAAL